MRSGSEGSFNVDRALLKSALATQLFGGSHGESVQLGRFRLLGRLGQGGMGVVYDAIDPERGSKVALKVLGEVGARNIYRLKREFRTLADVSHPNLVTLHELHHASGVWFFSMELVEGVPFDRWVTGPSGLDESRLRDALRQLACAVRAIHADGKLHRDLKPSNVLVTPEGRVVVLDFGLVGELAGQLELRQTGLAGTPAYIAPELARGGEACEASDWYSVGVMLFEALTGRLPFTGDPLEVLQEKQVRQAVDPRVLEADRPDDLSLLCLGLLESTPERRSAAMQMVSPDTSAGELISAALAQSTFVGRDDELSALGEAFTAACAGAPTVFWLAGPSGVGKSALLERFGKRCAERSLLLSGRCHEAESVPYKAFDWVIDALSQFLRDLPSHEVEALVPRRTDALLQLFPVLGQVPVLLNAQAGAEVQSDPRVLRDHAFSALRELLVRLSSRSPIAILVDDLHWGDLDSARLLVHLLSGRNPPALLFVGAYRSEERDRSEFLEALRATRFDADVSSLSCELGPLDARAADRLAEQLLGKGDALAPTIASESRGMPLFIGQLAHYVRQPDAARRHAPGSDVSLEHVIRARVAELPVAAQRLLQVVSLAMGPLDRGVACDAAELPSGDQATLLTLRAARLLRTRMAPEVETYHDRIREVVARDLSGESKRLVHARIARAMEQGDVRDPERLLAHYLGAEQFERAGHAAIEAAELSSEKLAFNRAAALYARAIALLSPQECRDRNLHSQLGRALVDAGRSAEAAQAFLQAAAGRNTVAARPFLCLAAQHTLRSGRSNEGLELVRRALRGVGVELPRSTPVCALRLNGSYLRLLLRGYRLRRRSEPVASSSAERLAVLGELSPELSGVAVLEGSVLRTEFVLEALDSGDVARSLQGLAWEVLACASAGGSLFERRAATIAPYVQELAAELGTPYARGVAQFAESGRLLCLSRRFRDSREIAVSALELFERCNGAFWERALVTFNLLMCLEWEQLLPEVSRHAQELSRDARERDDRFGALLSMASASYVHLMADDPSTARQLLERHREWLAPSPTSFHFLWLLRSIETASYAGAAGEGLALYDREMKKLRVSVMYMSEMIRATNRLSVARCAMVAYVDDGVRAARKRVERFIVMYRSHRSAFAAFAIALQASLYHADGEHSRAVAALETACRAFEENQSGFGIYSERMLHDLRGDHAAVERIDEHLRIQGVTNPERWARNHLPYHRRSPRPH